MHQGHFHEDAHDSHRFHADRLFKCPKHLTVPFPIMYTASKGGVSQFFCVSLSLSLLYPTMSPHQSEALCAGFTLSGIFRPYIYNKKSGGIFDYNSATDEKVRLYQLQGSSQALPQE